MGVLDNFRGAAKAAVTQLTGLDPIGAAQAAIATISPVPFDLKACASARAIVIHEDDLNAAIAHQLAQAESAIASMTIKLQPGNDVTLTIRPRLPGMILEMQLTLVRLEVSRDVAVIVLQLASPISAHPEYWFDRALSVVVQAVMRKVFCLDWIRQSDPDHIAVVGDQVIVDLRNGALSQLYETKLNDASPVSIPILGNLRAIDILRIPGARTGDHTLILDARFNFTAVH